MQSAFRRHLLPGLALVKRIAHASGVLPAWHRVSNRETLTVAMFHRVVPERDPRWAYCDPEYTVSDRVFAGCLDFFRAHYRVIGVDQLLDEGAALPARALLITLDDGWSDNEEFARPLLAAARMPGLVFVAATAVDAPVPRPFWEMRLVHAFRRGRLGKASCTLLWSRPGLDDAPAPAFDRFEHCLALISRLERLPLQDQQDAVALVEQHFGESPDDRQLLTRAQLRALQSSDIAIGCHGFSHDPLTRVADAVAELDQSRRSIGDALAAPAPTTMSFPHGAYDRAVADAALAAGFRYAFTSDSIVNRVVNSRPASRFLGRIGIFQSEITDGNGNFRPDLLALRLFRREVAVLSGARPLRPA